MPAGCSDKFLRRVYPWKLWIWQMRIFGNFSVRGEILPFQNGNYWWYDSALHMRRSNSRSLLLFIFTCVHNRNVTSLKRWVLLIYRYVGYVFVLLCGVDEFMSRVCCLSEGFWEYIVVPSACFSVSYSEYYLFVHAVYGDYFTAFTNNAVFIHTMVKSGTQYPYVRTAYDGVCWPGVLCGSADLRILQRVKCG